MAQLVKIEATKINKLSTIMRSSLATANAAMDLGDYETAVEAEANFVKAYQAWHKAQEKRRA